MGHEADRWSIPDPNPVVVEVPVPQPELYTGEREAKRWNVPPGTVQEADNVWRGPPGPGGGDFSVDGFTSAAIQTSIDAAGLSGGTVFFPKGDYYLDDPISLPPEITKTLLLSGYGAIIHCSASAPRFLDCIPTADYQNFNNIAIEGFAVDGNGTTGSQHLVLGSNVAGLTSGRRMNWENILVRDVYSYGVIADPTAIIHRTHYFICTSQLGAGEGTENHLRDITIQNVRMEGGNSGIQILGLVSGAMTPGYNMTLDRIRVDGWYHDTGRTPDGVCSNSNVHVGQNASGGSVYIGHGYGKGSGDVGVEVNGIASILVEDVTIEDAVHAFYHCNYEIPNGHQTASWRNCHVRVTSGDGTNGTTGFTFGDQAGSPLGVANIEGCSYYSTVHELFGWGCGVSALDLVDPERITVRDFSCTVTDAQRGSGDTNTQYFGIFITTTDASSELETVLENVSIDVTATRSRYLATLGRAYLAGKQRISVSDVDLALTTSSGSLYGVWVSGQASSAIHGVIERVSTDFSGANDDIGGVIVGVSTTLTIPTSILIRDCDLTTVLANPISVGDGTNMAKVRSQRNTLDSSLVATYHVPVALTPIVSPYTYVNLDYLDEDVMVHGGDVSYVNLSRDRGTTFTPTGVTSGVFSLSSGDQLQIVLPSVTATGLVAEWWGHFAKSATLPGNNVDPTVTWRDNTGSGYDGTLTDVGTTTASGWGQGTGLPETPTASSSMGRTTTSPWPTMRPCVRGRDRFRWRCGCSGRRFLLPQTGQDIFKKGVTTIAPANTWGVQMLADSDHELTYSDVHNTAWSYHCPPNYECLLGCWLEPHRLHAQRWELRLLPERCARRHPHRNGDGYSE